MFIHTAIHFPTTLSARWKHNPTEAFLHKPWTNAELEAAFSTEMSSGKKFLLPVLCVDAEKAFQRFPLLRPRRYLALPTHFGDLAMEIASILGRKYLREWTHNHPKEYSGEVHITLQKQPAHASEPVTVYVEWGRLRKRAKLPANDHSAITLMHTKGDDGQSVPLFVRADKPVFARFGLGRPKDGKIMDINSWWLPTKWM